MGFLTFGTVVEVDVVRFVFEDIHTAVEKPADGYRNTQCYTRRRSPAMKPVFALVALYHEALRVIGLLTSAIQNIVFVGHN